MNAEAIARLESKGVEVAGTKGAFTTVDCRKSDVRDEDLSAIAKLERVTWVALSGLPITNSAAQILGDINSLQTLLLDHTLVDGSGLAFIERLRDLRVLKVAGLQQSRQALSILASHPSLISLSLTNSDIDLDGFIVLVKETHIEYLNVEFTSIGEDDVETLDQPDADPFRLVSVTYGDKRKSIITRELSVEV